MKLKKLKRLLSLTLSAVMVSSMVSAPVNAETAAVDPGTVLEETIDTEQEADGEEGVSGADKAEQAEEEQSPSQEDAEVKEETTGEKGARREEAESKGAREESVQKEGVKVRSIDDLENNAGIVNAETAENAPAQQAETPPAQPQIIVVGDQEGQIPELDAALEQAAAGQVIELAKNVTLTSNLDDVTIQTKGHKITIPEGAAVQFGAKTSIVNDVEWSSGKNATTLLVQGNLTIEGGTYHTAGIQLLMVENGTATVTGGDFKCTKTQDGANYDAKMLVGVNGVSAKLVITGGTVDANVGNGTNCGMYGIYVWNGGELKAGQRQADGSTSGPTVKSMFPAITMNGTTAPGRITVEGGTYESSVACTASNDDVNKDEVKFNSVIYLPATATVKISGGTFKATGNLTGNDAEKAHVISIPYVNTGAAVRLNLNITGGTFQSAGTVFNYRGKEETSSKVKVSVTGGEFSSKISQELAEGSIPSGYECYESDTAGMWRVAAPAVAVVDGRKYTDFRTAVQAARAAGKSLELPKDIELDGGADGTIDISDVTIDTKGHTITIPEGKSLRLTGGTVKNDTFAAYDSSTKTWTKTGMIFDVQGNLTIDKGTYETRGVHMFKISGSAEINGGNFRANAGTDDIQNIKSCYDGAPLISVTGSGNLKVNGGTLEAKVGNADKTCGMYGIYVNDGGTLTLGQNNGQEPKIESIFAPVAMNGLHSPGQITINGGEYISHASNTQENDVKFNAVLYLPATADVTINGGSFTAKGTAGEQHVISIPYSTVTSGGSTWNVGLDLVVNGGTFVTGNQDTDKIFHSAKEDSDEINVTVRGGSFSKKPEYFAGCGEPVQKDGVWVVPEDAEHEIKWVATKDSTCWEEGLTGHYECSKCHRMYPSKEAVDSEELTAEDLAILKKEHTGEEVPEKAAENPCTQDSNRKYAKCENCGNYYASQEDLGKNQNPGKETEYITKALGHDYFEPAVSGGQDGNETDGSENAREGEDNGDGGAQQPEYHMEVDTSNFNLADFHYGQANGVTAKLICNRKTGQDKLCKHELPAAEVSVRVDAESLKPNCTQGAEVELVVEAVFEEDEFERPITNAANKIRVTKKVKYQIEKKQHTFTADDVELDWSAFDVSAFVTGQDNGVTATAVCKECKEKVTPATVSVTCANYPGKDKLSCKEQYEFTAKVTIGTALAAGGTVPSVQKKESFYGTHNLKKNEGSYEKATCMHEGRNITYTCQNEGCGKEFLNEDEAKLGNVATEAQKTIPKLAHVFNMPKFNWIKDEQGKNTKEAQAVFTCSGCGHTVVIGDLTPSLKDNQTAKCGEETTLEYVTAVKFDKSAVGEENVGEANEGLTYPNPVPESGNLYTGSLQKTEMLPHQIDKLTVEDGTLKADWVGEITPAAEGSGKYYDIAKGVNVTVKCKREGCGKSAVIKNPSQIMDDTDQNSKGNLFDDDCMEGIIPIVSLERDTEHAEDKDATCKQDGKAFYKVKVIYRDGTDTPVEIGETTISTATPKNENAHKWTEPVWTWTQQKENGGLQTASVLVLDTVSGKMIRREVPKYKVTAAYQCQEEGCNVKRNLEKILGEEPAEDAQTPEQQIQIAVSYQKGETCAKSSRIEYTASVYEGVNKVAATKTPEVYIEAAKGHQLSIRWNWESDAAEGKAPTRYTKVTATRYCTVCSDDENGYQPKEISVEKLDELESGKTASQTGSGMKLEVTKTGQGATCEEAGEAVYEAYLKELESDEQIAEDKKELSSGKLDHDFKWYVQWNQKTAQTGKADGETIAPEKDPDEERWTAERIKKCQRCDKQESGDGNKVAMTVAYEKTPATCIAAGSKVWTITDSAAEGVEYFDSQTNSDGTLKEEEGISKKVETVEKTPDVHEFGEAEVVWDEAAAETGEEEITVTCTRTCIHAKDAKPEDNHPAPEEVELKAVKQENTEDMDCAQGVSWTYQVDDTSEVDGWDLPADTWKDGVYTHTVEAGKHSVKIVKALISNDCTKPAYPTHYVCTVCKKMFKNFACTAVYEGPTEGSTEAQGHLYGEPEFRWVEGNVGEKAEARVVCTRSGCTDETEGHNLNVPAQIHSDQTLKGEEAQCPDTERGALEVDGYTLRNGEGYQWVRVTAEIDGVEQEAPLHKVLPAENHHFVDGECEWCHKEGGITVIFYGRDNSSEMGRTYLSEKDLSSLTAADVELVTAVNQLGYRFEGWTMEADGAVSKDIRAEILAKAKELTDTKEVQVYPVYERDTTGIGTVKVQYVLRQGTAETEVKEAVQQDLAVSSRYETAAKETETAADKTVYFSHWERGGVIVGTGLNYELYVQKASVIGLKAVYVADQSDVKEQTPKIAITDIYTSIVDDANKLSFSQTMAIPEEGYEVREVGFLYSTAEITEEHMEVDKVGTKVDGVTLPHRKYVFAGNKNTNIYTFQILDKNADRKIWARPYVTVFNTKLNKVETIYGNIHSSSFNEAKASQEAGK